MENFVIDREWVSENYHDEVNFTIPDGAAEIGADAFKENISLKSIHLPDSVTEIGKGAFAHCTRFQCGVVHF